MNNSFKILIFVTTFLVACGSGAADSFNSDSGSGFADPDSGVDSAVKEPPIEPIEPIKPAKDSGFIFPDSSFEDAGTDAGDTLSDSGTDAGDIFPDSGTDAGDVLSDSGTDAGTDSGFPDSGFEDSGTDSGVIVPCFFTRCGNDCVDLNTDPDNCGACGYAVVNGRACTDGIPTPAWQSISTIGAPPARTFHTAVFLDNAFFVAGGSLSVLSASTTTTGRYLPDTDTWTPSAPLRTAKAYHSAVAGDGVAYIFGGQGSQNLEKYDPSTNMWTDVTPSGTAPGNQAFPAMLWTSTKKLFIFGGASYSSMGSIFDPIMNAWNPVSCSLSACGVNSQNQYTAAFEDGGVVNLLGNHFTNSVPTVVSRPPSYTLSTGEWSTWDLPLSGAPISFPLKYADDGERIFFLDSPGSSSGCISSRVLIYDRVSSSWSADMSIAPTGLLSGAAVAWSGHEVIAWSGACATAQAVQIGGRYQPPAPTM